MSREVEMNKAQKWTIEICLLLIVISIIIPPFFANQYNPNGVKLKREPVGWDFLWEIHQSAFKNERFYHAIDFSILALEWLAIITLGSFFFLYFRKIK
jgi:hypothetical protein